MSMGQSQHLHLRYFLMRSHTQETCSTLFFIVRLVSPLCTSMIDEVRHYDAISGNILSSRGPQVEYNVQQHFTKY